MRHRTKESPDTESPDLAKELLELEVAITNSVVSAQKLRKKVDCFYYETDSEEPHFKDSTSYYSEFWKIFIINQFMVTQLKELSDNVTHLHKEVSHLETLGEQYVQLLKQKNKKKNRRLSAEISKEFKCPYTNCYKVYGTDVSLNLHMKIKHNGGNKTQRQALAKQYARAIRLNLPLPHLTISFPPGYLETFIKNFKKEQPPRE